MQVICIAMLGSAVTFLVLNATSGRVALDGAGHAAGMTR